MAQAEALKSASGSEAMKILMITKFVPAPANSGGKRRSLAILEALTKFGHVTLCAFEDDSSDPRPLEDAGVTVRGVPWRPEPVKVLRGLARTGSISAARFWDPALARAVAEAASAGVDHLQVEHIQLTPYARGIGATRRFLDMENVESALAGSYASARRRPAQVLYRAEALALRRMEKRALGTFVVTSVVSETDRRLLPAPSTAIVVPNGWNPSAVPLPAATEPVAAFVALMGWRPNDDAARWLCSAIWPLVVKEVPDAALLLVGREPSEAVRAFDGPNVHVTGTVADVAPYLERARVGLAPLRVGGGSRLKVLEALDAGRPVVATTKGAEGLEDLVGKGVVVADRPRDIAAAIAELLSDPDRAQALGRAGRAAVAERHSWRVVLEPLVNAIGDRDL